MTKDEKCQYMREWRIKRKHGQMTHKLQHKSKTCGEGIEPYERYLIYPPILGVAQ